MSAPHPDYADNGEPLPAFLQLSRIREVKAKLIPVNLDQLAHDLTRNRLDEIAVLIQSLTYGEMMDLAAKLWQARPVGEAITKAMLPEVWHRWSAKHE